MIHVYVAKDNILVDIAGEDEDEFGERNKNGMDMVHKLVVIKDTHKIVRG